MFQISSKPAINEEFVFCGGQILSVVPDGGRGIRFQKLEKILIQNSGLNPHRKFQHSSSVRKCSKIGGNKPTFGGSDFKNSKKSHTERLSKPTPKISAFQLIRHSVSNLGDFQSPMKTSILDILTREFLQYVRVCQLKRKK